MITLTLKSMYNPVSNIQISGLHVFHLARRYFLLLFVFIKNPIKMISFLCNDVILNNDDIFFRNNNNTCL